MSKKKNEGTKFYTKKTYPDMSGYKAYILNGAFYGDVVSLMAECGFERADSVKDADVVVFIGGADINPDMYGQRKHQTTSYNDNRDILEKIIFQQCVELKKPMFGICRGAQILHALNTDSKGNPGQLWQDVNNHGGMPHLIVDIEDDVRVMATSIHHQMLKDNDKLCIVAVTENVVATRFADGDMSFRTDLSSTFDNQPLEIEAGVYEDTGCFFVQGHPEVGCEEYRSWCMWKLHNFLADWDLKITDHSEELQKIEIQNAML